MKTQILVALAGLLTFRVGAQSVLFDFDNAPLQSPFPIDLTVGGITAHLSATGAGYSIQSTTTAPDVPVGFSGRFIYPSSINAADLLVGFSTPLTDFSILYASQELACDSSATIRVTAYLNGTFVATATTNATWNCTCTWTAQILPLSSAQPFNSVVVHYDAPPLPSPNPCQDYGVIFLADNMTVTPAPPPLIVTNVVKLANGPFQFSFIGAANTSFSVFGATNPTLPLSNWAPLVGLSEAPPGHFQFTDWQVTNMPRRFYRVSSP
jgi:hypothetical protein